MKFVDVASVKVVAGDGGPGAVSFRREKYVPQGGPDGGHGGNGGDVYLRARAQIQTLMDLHMRRVYKAKNGLQGGGKNCSGSRGADCIIDIPCGTQVFGEDGALIVDMCHDGELFMIAKGGKGGAGNDAFTSSVNRAPRYAQAGLPGEEKVIKFELKLLADVGLVGLPNAGKSTLLKALTNATPKVASYPFTTLFPNLGVLKFIDREIVIADIPGLIEGASEGVGLGHEFLRHVSRTKVLIHLVSCELGDASVCFDEYQVIISEIGKSFPEMLEKPTIVVISKADILLPEQLDEICAFFESKGVSVFTLSAVTGFNLELLIQTLVKKLN